MVNRGDKCLRLAMILLQVCSPVDLSPGKNIQLRTFCISHGQSVVCPEKVQGQTQTKEGKAAEAGRPGTDAS